MKKSIRKIIVTIVATFQLSAVAQATDAEAIQTRIVSKDTRVKLESEDIFSLTKMIVPQNTIVKLIKIVDDDYAMVEVEGQQGIILRNELKYPVKYVKKPLNLRESPEDGNIICTMETGTRIAILQSENGWARCMYGEKVGYCSEEFLTDEHIIGSYSTYLSGDPGNTNNIQVAANFLNGRIVKKGEVFSYLDAIGGESTPELGYMEANVIVNGTYQKGYGGGVCQVSSTLYAALKQIPNFDETVEIKERQPHQKPVGYVPVEYEATVWYPTIDFKFMSKKDIKIEASVEEGELQIDIIEI